MVGTAAAGVGYQQVATVEVVATISVPPSPHTSESSTATGLTPNQVSTAGDRTATPTTLPAVAETVATTTVDTPEAVNAEPHGARGVELAPEPVQTIPTAMTILCGQ